MMVRRRNSYLSISLFLLTTPFIASVDADAAMFTAASCSRTDVATAIAAAADGDTVNIPPCAATIWTSGISVER